MKLTYKILYEQYLELKTEWRVFPYRLWREKMNIQWMSLLKSVELIYNKKSSPCWLTKDKKKYYREYMRKMRAKIKSDEIEKYRRVKK